MKTMTYVMAFVAFVAMVGSASAFVNIQVSASNGQETYGMAAGASPSIAHDDAFASFSTTFDMSGEFAHTTRMSSVFYETGDYYTYTNDIVGNHVHLTYFSHMREFGDFATSIDQDIDGI